MLDFLWPLYHWLYRHGRLYDKNLKVYVTDRSIERFSSILNALFHCKIITRFDYNDAVGMYRVMVLGMEAHNRRLFGLTVGDYISRPREYIRHFREYVFERLGIEPGAPNKMILVQRKMTTEDRGGGRRNIENHESVEKALSVFAEMYNLSFHNVVLEDMSFIEQVELFSSAKLVVGQHGAGLCHFLWMPIGSALNELHESDKEAYRFGQFCAEFGLWHKNLICPKGDSNKNIVVPINELVNGLDKMMRWKDGR